MTNFTAKYLGLLGNTIGDANGNPISTIKIIKDNEFFFDYKKPILTYDVLLKGAINEPDITEISYNELERMGYIIISIKSRIRGKNVVYRLHKKIKRVPENAKVMAETVRATKIEYDMANNLIRLVGDYSLGDWVKI